MSFLSEVCYRPPADLGKEAALTARVADLGGRLSYREAPAESGSGGICLTYDFDEREPALAAAELLRQQGTHVEGPVDYGG
jgi:hypothetical protein